MTQRPGIVYLVGAGPGDVGLLTLRGRDCLAAADLVLYDGLVNPDILAIAGGVCERTARVVKDGDRRIDQDEVNRRLIAAAREGQTVCRLKGGDPYIFGRGSEEAAALARAGIPFEVVPGVTAATASGAYAGFSLTHRDLSSAVALITGHERPGKPASMLDYDALARFPGTLVFYMGLHRLPEIAARLVDRGLPADVPAAVVSKASLPEQRVLSGSLGELPDLAAAANLQPPSLIVVGQCVRLRDTLAWFERQPLFGLTVGVCRPIDQCDDAIHRIQRLGGRGVALPTIRIAFEGHEPALDDALATLGDHDWIALTSSNAVRAVCDRLLATGRDARALAGVRIGCVGAATADSLAAYGLRADLIASDSNGASLADDLIAAGVKRVWFPAANRASRSLPDRLAAASVHVTETVVYSSRDVERWPDDSNEVDWIAVSSSTIATQVGRLLRRDDVRIATISENVAAAARAAGLRVDAVAERSDWDGLLDAIATHRV